jgi:hypothetical protein
MTVDATPTAEAELVELLTAHGWRDNWDDGEFIGYICNCRAPESGPYDTDLARHIADVILAAGLAGQGGTHD